MKQKGFTLIELLVVVAIIAILATTILASLGAARAKAKLARAQSEISSMRAAAELTTGSSGGYPVGSSTVTDLFDDTASGMKNLVADVEAKYPGKTKKVNTGGAWGFSLQYDTGKYFCADSSGYAGESSAEVSSAGVCTQVLQP